LIEIKIGSFFIIVGGLTMLMAGLAACFEKDIKKIVAISTLRQLGLMIFILFQGFIELSFFHISCHALFKALLFLCCGLFILRSFGMQDSRKIGVLGGMIFIRGLGLIGSTFRLIGFPFSSGFYSKDLLIESSFYDLNFIYNFFILFGCFFTLIYSLRLIWVGLIFYKIGFLQILNYEFLGILKFMLFIYLYMVTIGVYLSWELEFIN